MGAAGLWKRISLLPCYPAIEGQINGPITGELHTVAKVQVLQVTKARFMHLSGFHNVQGKLLESIIFFLLKAESTGFPTLMGLGR
eukprot:g12141.t1